MHALPVDDTHVCFFKEPHQVWGSAQDAHVCIKAGPKASSPVGHIASILWLRQAQLLCKKAAGPIRPHQHSAGHAAAIVKLQLSAWAVQPGGTEKLP